MNKKEEKQNDTQVVQADIEKKKYHEDLKEKAKIFGALPSAMESLLHQMNVDERTQNIKKLAEWLDWYYHYETEHYPECWRQNDGLFGAKKDWNPYESIADAWLLVEKLKSISEELEINIHCYGDSWEFHLYDHPDYIIGEHYGVGNNTQQAICQAVLEYIYEQRI